MAIAISNIVSLGILWTQQFIVEQVQVNENLETYIYAQIGLGTLVLLFLLPFHFFPIFGLETGCLQKLDRVRVEERDVTSGSKVKPRRVSLAIDYITVTTANDFASRRASALQFRNSVVETMPRGSIFRNKLTSISE